ncbi:hypothetical protein I4U23_006091 [Adineta vaga]|nr:hypothetical protein I4U23_006091 [Adineta vaga]
MYFETIAGDKELVVENEKCREKKFIDYESESYYFALKLHEEFNKNSSIIENQIDSTLNIQDLFNKFNSEYFYGNLSSAVIQWDKQMINSPSICLYATSEPMCRIVLSEPLLISRSRNDLIEILLHEMIHAYLFITNQRKDRYAHDEEFLTHMIRINQSSGMNITIYHQFLDKIDSIRQHWWRCTGICQNWKPFFGYVKRSLNRIPSKKDYWFVEHQRCCNGQFLKVKEPSNEKILKTINPSINEPFTKKWKGISNVELIKPTPYVECKFCHQSVHRQNLQVHIDIKCSMHV